MKDHNPLNSPYDPSRLAESHAFINETYLKTFSEAGYTIEPAKSIANEEVDPSVIFIGSTISALKNFYTSDTMSRPGRATIQPCIRTHNLKNIYNDLPNKGNTFFNLAGGLAEGDCFMDVYKTTLDFLSRTIGDKISKIYVRVSPEDKDFISYLTSEMNLPPIEVGSKSPSSYRWKFGLEGVVGRGVSIAIRDEKNPKGYMTFGNIIFMESDRYPLATQWGYGIESIISGVHQKPHVIEGSKAVQAVPYSPELSKYIDSLIGVIEMSRSGLMPVKSGPNRFMRFYLKGLSYQIDQLGISDEQIQDHVNKYYEIKHSDGAKSLLPLIYQSNLLHRRHIKRFNEHLTEGKISLADQITPEQIGEISNKFRLHPDEVASLLSSSIVKLE
jgi:hypothetical protein